MGHPRHKRRTPMVLLTLVLLGAGCGGGDKTPTLTPVSSAGGKPLPMLATLPPFSLTSQSGDSFGSRQLRGRIWVANFIFTRCPGICPILTSRMSGLQKKLADDKLLGETRLVSLTVDPEHDTPEVLKAYAQRSGADPDRWNFLTGPREAIWSLSRSGFKLPVEPDANPDATTPIVHSPQLILVDRTGRIRGLYDGQEEASVDEIVRDVAVLLAEPRPIGIPPDVFEPAWMQKRGDDQNASAGSYGVFHDFRFTDRLPESGITFRHECVDDLKKVFQSTHYDHGNGVAVADVDGDGLLDIYFTSQLGGNELWRNTGGGRFTDITSTSGVGMGKTVSVAAAFGDIDNDGDPDLFVSTVRGGNALFENQGKGIFRDISANASIAHVGHSSGAAFLDYDGDGLLDLFVTNVGKYTSDVLAADGHYVSLKATFDGHLKPERYETSILYRNLGGNRFKDVTVEMGVAENGWNGDVHPTSFDPDGRPGLYLINMQGRDSYFRNDSGKRFVRQPPETFSFSPFGSMGIGIFDFNNDSQQDLYIVDMHIDMLKDTMFNQFIEGLEKQKLPEDEMPSVSYLLTDGKHVRGNAFYRNDGSGKFTEISDQIGAETYWPWGLSHGDFNADGWRDVFIPAGMNYPFRYQVNSLLLNEQGKRFLDSEFVVGVEPRRDRRTATPWFTLDCSGADREHKDCTWLTTNPDAAQSPGGSVEVWAALASRSSVVFDLDEDGDEDLVVLDFNSEPLVLINNLSDRRTVNQIKVRLIGTESNRSGIGATVTVRAGGRTYTRVNDGKSGYLAQSDLPLYFGLDDAAAVDGIEVLWPTGRRQLVSGPVAANKPIEITEATK